MKKLLLILPVLLLALFAWLGTMEQPAPTKEVQTSLPASQVIGK